MVGKTISHYKILEKIGAGGMGVVYKANDLKLDRFVALKFLPFYLSSDEQRKKRFIQEAKAASALDHANIGTIHEFSETENGQMFIVMAYYDGESLKDRLQRKPMEFKESVEIAIQIAKGLARAHEAGIIHRDIKPANIILTQRSEVKIIDFGLAKKSTDSQVTKDGVATGTIAYMSPEQVLGHSVDSRTDIWSLGVVLYEMLTAELPFKGEFDQAIIYSILKKKTEPLLQKNQQVNKELQNIINKALEKDRNKRYQNVDDFLTELLKVRDTTFETLSKQLPVVNSGLKLRIRKHRVPLIGLFILMFVFAGYFTISKTFVSKQTDLVLAVAPFWGLDETEIKEGQRMQANVVRMLREEFKDEPDLGVLVANPEIAPHSDEEAKIIGAQLNASAIMWGEVLTLENKIEFQPYITKIKELQLLPPEAKNNDPIAALKIGYGEPNQISLRKAKAKDIVNLGLQMAAIYYSNQDDDKSISLLEKIEPPTSESLYLLGIAHAHKNLSDEAKAYYLKAIELDSMNAKPHVALGRIYVGQKNFTEAMKEFEKAGELAPKTYWSHHELAILHNDLYNFDKALQEAQRAVHIDPQLPEVQSRLANIYLRLGKFDQALKLWENIVKKHPEYNIRRRIAFQYLKTGRIEETKKWVNNDAEFNPEGAEGIRAYFSAEISKAQGRFEDAISHWRKLLELNPNHSKAVSRIGQSYFYLGYVDEAIALHQKAIQMDSSVQWFHHDLAFVYVDQKKYDLAIAAFERALDINPYEQFHYIGLAGVYLSQDLFNEAIVVYENALKLFPESIYLNLYYSFELARAGKVQEARAVVEKFSYNLHAEGWQNLIVRFYLGKITESEVEDALLQFYPLKYASNLKDLPYAPGGYGTAYHFLGMAHLLNLGEDSTISVRDTTKAISYFQKTLAHLHEDATPYPLAKAELKWLGVR